MLDRDRRWVSRTGAGILSGGTPGGRSFRRCSRRVHREWPLVMWVPPKFPQAQYRLGYPPPVLWVPEPPNTRDAELVRGGGSADRAARGVVAVLLEERVQVLDPTSRELRGAVGELGKQGHRVGPKAEDLLPLLVESSAFPVHGGDLRRAVLGKRRRRISLLPAPLLGHEAARHDAHAVLVEEHRARDVRGLGRHRVRDAVVQHLRGGSDEDGHAQGEVLRKDLDRPKPRELLLPPRFRNHAGRPRWGLRVRWAMSACDSPTLRRTWARRNGLCSGQASCSSDANCPQGQVCR
jgi:hypothetical protein